MGDYLEKAIGKEPKVMVTVYWDPATKEAAKIFCARHRGWNMSTFSEAAILEKLEREKIVPPKPDLVMHKKA